MKKLWFVVFIIGLFVGNFCFAGFPAGTVVKMLNGSTEKIETMSHGKVLYGGGIVEKVVLTTTGDIVVLELLDNKKIKTTNDQYFFIMGGYCGSDSVMKCGNLGAGYWIKCLPSELFPEVESSIRILEKRQEISEYKIIVYGLKIEGKDKYYFADDLKVASE